MLRRAGAEDRAAGALRDAWSDHPGRRHLAVVGADGAAARVRDRVGLPVFVVRHDDDGVWCRCWVGMVTSETGES